MVAMVILTIGLVAIAELMAVTLRLQMLGRNQTEAVRLAQDKLDDLMSLNFTTAASITIGGSLTANVANHNDAVTGYTRRWLVEAGPDSNPDLRLVTVRVSPILTDRRTSTPLDIVTIIRRW